MEVWKISRTNKWNRRWERKKKLEQYDRLRKNLEKAKGIPEILQENLKEGGKYIVFIPVEGMKKEKTV